MNGRANCLIRGVAQAIPNANYPSFSFPQPSNRESWAISAVTCDGLRFHYQLKVLPVVTGHDAAHELIEQGHGEGGVAVIGTPNHAFGDELVARRA